jgi:hypothetical protein
MTTPETTAVAERLQAELAAMLDPRDIPGSWTPRQRDDYETKRHVFEVRIRTIHTASDELAELEPQIDALKTWCVRLPAWRQDFAQQLAACPAHPETRADEYKILGLKISIQCIDRGFDFENATYPPNPPIFTAMREAGYGAPVHSAWNVWAGGMGSMPTAERRLADLQQRLDAAQAKLDWALREPVSV